MDKKVRAPQSDWGCEILVGGGGERVACERGKISQGDFFLAGAGPGAWLVEL